MIKSDDENLANHINISYRRFPIIMIESAPIGNIFEYAPIQKLRLNTIVMVLLVSFTIYKTTTNYIPPAKSKSFSNNIIQG
jgi:hypothetical protein